ncbi:hypothetical protein QBC38DRAFT_455635 [Podospora fimiseda]|uniref:Uncharacterized protein n=1 Tax=Podospora fimiseda TaxID=252190 RepID=A0AAN7H1U8_9PEZI|nr:hypothetical protein QBC38DRAFT_455635 [Podospora fimiseda]
MIGSVLGVVALAATAIAANSPITFPYVAITRAPTPDAAGTKDPIRTVITLNSKPIDVLAAEEHDVPKVLEKLRELCAGPYATLYPEICDHLNQPVYWPLTETTIKTLPTTVTNAIYHSTTVIRSIYVPTTVTASSTFTAFMRSSTSSSLSFISSSFRSSSSSSLAPTRTSTTKPTNPLKHPPFIPKTTSSMRPTSPLKRPSLPKTTSTRPTPSSPSPRPYISTRLSKGTKPKGTTPTKDYPHIKSNTTTPLKRPTSFSKPTGGIASPFMRERIQQQEEAEERPENNGHPDYFYQTRRPRPTHFRQLKDLQAFSSISYFRSNGEGCTQTMPNFKKVTDFYTVTAYAETVTTTKRFDCWDCPNIIIVQVGGPGVILEPKTTVWEGWLRETKTVWGCRESGIVE